MVVLGLLGSSETIIQIISAMVILYCFLEWQIRESPFVHSFHNKLEAYGLFVQLLLTGFTFYFMSALTIRGEVLDAISYTLMTLVLIFIAVCVTTMVAQAVRGTRRIAAVIPDSKSERQSFEVMAPPPSGNVSDVFLSDEDPSK